MNRSENSKVKWPQKIYVTETSEQYSEQSKNLPTLNHLVSVTGPLV